jgi:hypothetical protein
MTDIKVTINDDGQICYNNPMAIEIAALTLEPGKAVSCLMRMADDTGNGNLAEGIERYSDFPKSRKERRRRMLAVISAYGRAAGEELARLGHGGQCEPYLLSFFQGVTSERDPESVVGCSLDKLFYLIGWTVGGYFWEAIYRDGRRAGKKELIADVNDITDAFLGGMKTCME